MRMVTIDEAQAMLDRLIEEACEGKEIVVSRSGVPLVRLEPVRVPVSRRRGSLEGQVFVPDAFFDPLPGDETGS